MTFKEITNERNTTHGDFAENARISQRLKAVMRRDDYTAVQQEAIDMICLKLSRIASGHAGYDDHWKDIGGYAQLVIDEINTNLSP